MFDQLQQALSKNPPVADAKPMARTFIANIFTYMFVALGISAVAAYFFVEFELYLELVSETGLNGLGYLVMFAPLGIALLMQMAYHRFSIGTLIVMLAAYSILIGASLSFIFLIYTPGSIVVTFLVAAGTFASMAFLGYTTKTDLTKFGSIMMMLFWGLFIAMMVNWFIGSETLDFVFSGIGVLLMTGLTAFKLQQFKYMSYHVGDGTVEANKLAIIGGLQLYILFINLFLFLLRFMGNRE